MMMAVRILAEIMINTTYDGNYDITAMLNVYDGNDDGVKSYGK